jgi:ATP-dependent Clp protease ATP-binding subunit ClpC
MGIYGAFSLGILFMVIVFLVNDRLSKRARQRRSALEPPYLPDNQVGMPAVDEQTEQSSQRSDAVGLRIQLYTIAQEIEGFFQSTAHPADMRGTDEFELAVSHLLSSAFTLTDVRDFAFGDNQLLSCMALESLARRPDGGRLNDDVRTRLNHIAPWPRYFGLEMLCGHTDPGEPLVGPFLLAMNDSWQNPQAFAFFEDFARIRVAQGEKLTFGSLSEPLDGEKKELTVGFLQQLEPSLAKPLIVELKEMERTAVDTGFLEKTGRVWGDAPARDVVHTPELGKAVDRLEANIHSTPPRSMLLVGEAGTGKTTVVRTLAQRLQAKGWVIFEADHSDILAGQVFIGQLEDRLRQLTERLTGRRILWYIPAFQMLAYTGKHSASPICVLDVILPQIANNRFTVLGELTTRAYEQLLQTHHRCAETFDALRLEPMQAEEAQQLASQWASTMAAGSGEPLFSEETIREAWLLSRQYLTHRAAPGSLMDLLEQTRHRVAGPGGTCDTPLTLDDLIETLTRTSGLPSSLLDERQTLDLDGLHRLFTSRVVGQPEVVDCLVDRVTMIKAGLNDPTRPFGVFLFAGPTGTGKTEIAKTLAEFLFGSPERMIRLDMSELQTAESMGRIFGEEQSEVRGLSLAEQIRKQPFSVVLLDEFEKAHPRVWDVFLQVFDDGRLTDWRGLTTDCRHVLFILTSNLGSAIRRDGGLGFTGEKTPFNPGEVRDAVQKAFRKEFLNRLDRVVIFRPLGREVIRRILNKELEEAFQRRGLRNRAWAVVWDEAALEFLLEQGFTAELGARPLKRAVERYLLTPLANAIVGHETPSGDQFLFLRRGAEGLEVEFVDPDATDIPAEEAGEPEPAAAGEEDLRELGKLVLDPRGTAAEVQLLSAHFERIRTAVESAEFSDTKQTALDLTGQPDFWTTPYRFSILGEVEYIDRIEAGFGTARSLFERLTGTGERVRERVPRQLIQRLAQRLFLLDAACETVRNGEPRDAFLLVEPALDTAPVAGGNSRFAHRIAGMYKEWSQLRKMDLRVLEESGGGTEPYRLLAAVSGYGVHRFLAPEHGLHVFETPEEGQDGKSFVRDKARVRVAAQPDQPAGDNLSDWIKQADDALGEAGPSDATVVRRYREQPSPLVRDGVSGWRTGRIDRVLGGDFDLFG